MFQIIGIVVVFASVILGYTMHHGELAVLWQPTEFIIIGGAGIGSFIVANPPSILRARCADSSGWSSRTRSTRPRSPSCSR